MQIRWFNPSGTNPVNTTWGALTNDGYSSHCFMTDLSIAQWIAPSFGAWAAQININGTVIGSPISFQVTNPIQPRGPSYTGSFDPIPTDCSHLFGWAVDSNDPATFLSVDISVPGFPLAHAAANLARSDLTGSLANHAWNFFNLQPYEDGQARTVHVYYGGTTVDLPGSPQTFPPAGGQGACVVIPSNGVSVSWVPGKQPPATLTGGQVITVGWNVSGPAIQSRVIYSASASPNPGNPQYSTPWLLGGNVSQQATFTLPSVSSPTLFTFMVKICLTHRSQAAMMVRTGFGACGTS